jgi:protein O-mannosyl-transferase
MCLASTFTSSGSRKDRMGIFGTTEFKKSFWVAFSLLGLLLLCYGNSFQSAWQYDDFSNIVNNTKIHVTDFSWSQIRKVFSAGPDFQIVGRPLAYLSFAFNYRLGADDPQGYHIVNFLIHWLAGFVLFLFVRDTLHLPSFGGRYASQATAIAWLSALLWACHPIQVTAVTYIVQRMTAMAGLFYVTALYAYLICRRSVESKTRAWAYAACALSVVCGMLTKENAVLIPFALLLYELLFFRTLDRRTMGKVLLAALGVTVVMLLLSALYTNPLKMLEPYPNRPFTMVERVLTQPRVIFIYLSLLAVPMASRMSILHDVAISKSILVPWTTLPAILGVVAIIVLLCLLARWHRLFAFCGLFFFLNHAVESSFINLELIYEHRNYVPSMLLFVPLAVGIVRVMAFFYYRHALRIMIAGCVGLLLMTHAQTTYEYNRVFADEFTLWHHVTLLYPNCSLAYNNLGKEYWRHGDYERSFQHVLKALELNNFNDSHQKGMAYYNLGLYAANVEKDFPTALARFEKARGLFEQLSSIWHEIARVRMHLGDFGGAEEVLVDALDRWPDDQFLNGLMAINKVKKGEYESAIQLATAALEADRIEVRIALMVIAQSHRMLNNNEAAMEGWRKLLEKDPDNAAALMALTEMYAALNQMDSAHHYLKRLLDSKGIDYLRNGVAFNIESKNIIPYVPDERIINEIARTMGTSRQTEP